VHRASGAPRSEIKEEPKAGDIRGGEYPVAFAQALNSSPEQQTPEQQTPPCSPPKFSANCLFPL
jgi:hypothetical protein